ncbi:formin-like protein 12 isoform X1 [Octopus sinensis]|uniref:Formin-like protein 12 isoform X1 n=1 Tax=Octopus sinensis TaxID=2607531 RepID=A0A6P7SSC7_9MOLL|nr:formin-like protein 12 isoform X1 [Octopus sinensis]
MATPRRQLFTLLIISTILLQFVVEFCDARRSSSTRISYARRSTRRYSRTSLSRSTLRTKYGRSISFTRNKISSIGWKQALVAGGLLYIGSRMYMSRRMYYTHPSRRPTICSNYVDADENGTVYKMFICPRHYESDSLTHCCGPEGQQRCCAATKTTGGIVGIVIGVIITVAIISAIIYCICRKKKKQRGHVIDKDGEGQEVIMGPPPVPMPPHQPGPMPMGYPPHPGMMPPPVMDPNQAQYPMNYGSTYGQPSCPPPPAGYPYPAPHPGEPVPGSVPPPYAQPIPSAPHMPPPGMPPAMPPQQPPPPGFYSQGPPPPHPPPPYSMP